MAGPHRDRELVKFCREHDLVAERGSKHWKLRLAATGEMVGIWPLSGRSHAHGASRSQQNLLSQIRRAQGRSGPTA